MAINRTFRGALVLAAALLALCGTAQAQPRDLEIIWIDTEGGAATLFIAPSGESMLIDTGYPDNDRDAKRIVAAAQAAGLSEEERFDIISKVQRQSQSFTA